LKGGDKNFDYSSVDNNSSFDPDWMDRDAENKYFDDDDE
jgi:hypothetical protein